jgi:hypothetical protein
MSSVNGTKIYFPNSGSRSDKSFNQERMKPLVSPMFHLGVMSCVHIYNFELTSRIK